MSRSSRPSAASRRRNWARTAAILAEALPHIQFHDGKTVVIKLGGEMVRDETALATFAMDMTLLRQCGVRPVVVHGGGPQIGAVLKELDIESRFVDGQRFTDDRTIEVVENVLAGTVNQQVVSAIQERGGKAVGLSGKDSRLMRAERLLSDRGEDLGFVGTPTEIDVDAVRNFLGSDLIPVIAPIGRGGGDETLNINADTAAGSLAGALGAARLLLLTDVEGVNGADGELLSELRVNEAESLIAEGVIGGGMIPKVRTACRAVAAGVNGAVILQGTAPHAALLELFTDHGAGTMILPE